MIKISNLTKKFKQHLVLDNINLEVAQGEKIAIVGASGSGKSTLLRCIAGLETYKGKIKCQGKIGMIFQQFNLFPHLTILENLNLAQTHVMKKPIADATHKSIELLKQVKLDNKKDAYPHNLSGGQKQRVAIARALALDPDIMLFDEPTSALDEKTANQIFELISEVAAKSSMTILLVTHEKHGVIKTMTDRIITMDKGHIV